MKRTCFFLHLEQGFSNRLMDYHGDCCGVFPENDSECLCKPFLISFLGLLSSGYYNSIHSALPGIATPAIHPGIATPAIHPEIATPAIHPGIATDSSLLTIWITLTLINSHIQTHFLQ